jgi:hypothetical protein
MLLSLPSLPGITQTKRVLFKMTYRYRDKFEAFASWSLRLLE